MALVALLTAPVMADPPAEGIYLSDDMPGGTMLTGHFSESWIGTGGHGQIGNTIHAESYDGATLGTEWRFWCASIDAPPVLVSDTRDADGTGEVTWRTTYGGGLFWLSGTGPWGNGSQDYTGSVDYFIVTTTYMYVFNNILGIRANVTTSGPFDGFAECLYFSINNVAFFGNTDDNGPKPAEFPEFMDDGCNTGTLSRGGWGSITEMAFQITGQCQVATEPSTWGKVKALYTE
jgi:hypothetical protein